VENDKSEDEDNGERSKDFDPAWHAGRIAFDIFARFPPGVMIAGQDRHAHLLKSRAQVHLSIQIVSVNSCCIESGSVYTLPMPKLWNDTIDAHRRAVREATIDTTAALVAEHGLVSVTMSQIAERTGIGRATLYKYFPDVETILVAWHERQIANHLAHLVAARDQPGTANERLQAVLEAFALISGQPHSGNELAAVMHRGGHVRRAQHQLSGLIAELLREGTKAGDIRDDVAPEELASYCLHALSAASSLQSRVAVRRLVTVTLAGLRRPDAS
jgi:AcrR family transcriptional regulator